MKRIARKLIALTLATVAALQGCATMQAHDVVPAQLADAAQVSDVGNVRFWGDAGAPAVQRLFAAEANLLRSKYESRIRAGQPLESNILAVSGGADDGAFGAGLMVGWGERGNRPSFDLVTGVSTGSLIAPFAFLGRDYDAQLAEIFVKYGGEDIYQANIVSGLLGGISVADNAPLARLIDGYVDRTFLARVAAERAKGRFLLIGTTNLNAQRPVYWDMGKIAQVGSPKALELFRKILLASAAVPGVFPPVHIEVTAGGRTYHEMHIDGGPTREVFFSPDSFKFSSIDAAIGSPVHRRLWIVRNGKLTPEYAVVPENTLAVAARSLETLTKSQGAGDLIRMHNKALADGIDYNLAYIPASFVTPRPKPFDRDYMQSLYATGYQLGRQGAPWVKSPPGTPHVQADNAPAERVVAKVRARQH